MESLRKNCPKFKSALCCISLETANALIAWHQFILLVLFNALLVLNVYCVSIFGILAVVTIVTWNSQMRIFREEEVSQISSLDGYFAIACIVGE